MREGEREGGREGERVGGRERKEGERICSLLNSVDKR